MAKISNSEISFYVDTLIVEAILGNNALVKNAGVIADMVDKIKEYVPSVIGTGDPVEGVLKFLAPGALVMTFSAMGIGWLGTLFVIALKAFGIDIGEIFGSIYEKIKSMLHTLPKGEQLQRSQVDNTVLAAIQSHSGKAASFASFLETRSSSRMLRDAKWIKLAMVDYEKGFHKNSFTVLSAVSKFSLLSIVGKVFGWIIKAALISGGLMIGGKVIEKVVGPSAQEPTHPIVHMPTSTQTKFKINPSYSPENNNTSSSWTVNIANDPSSIDNMLVNFAKDVYSGLDGKEQIIRSSNIFQKIKEAFVWHNKATPGAPIVFIPSEFKSKKQIVDFFIDDVASHIN